VRVGSLRAPHSVSPPLRALVRHHSESVLLCSSGEDGLDVDSALPKGGQPSCGRWFRFACSARPRESARRCVLRRALFVRSLRRFAWPSCVRRAACGLSAILLPSPFPPRMRTLQLPLRALRSVCECRLRPPSPFPLVPAFAGSLCSFAVCFATSPFAHVRVLSRKRVGRTRGVLWKGRRQWEMHIIQ